MAGSTQAVCQLKVGYYHVAGNTGNKEPSSAEISCHRFLAAVWAQFFPLYSVDPVANIFGMLHEMSPHIADFASEKGNDRPSDMARCSVRSSPRSFDQFLRHKTWRQKYCIPGRPVLDVFALPGQ